MNKLLNVAEVHLKLELANSEKERPLFTVLIARIHHLIVSTIEYALYVRKQKNTIHELSDDCLFRARRMNSSSNFAMTLHKFTIHARIDIAPPSAKVLCIPLYWGKTYTKRTRMQLSSLLVRPLGCLYRRFWRVRSNEF